MSCTDPKSRSQQAQQNKDEILARRRAHHKSYYRANKAACIAKVAKWRKANPDKTAAIMSRHHRKNRQLRPWIRASRIAITRAMTRHGYTKVSQTSEILGCSWETLREWIQALFTEGMSWDNYGEWHLDHMLPISMAMSEKECLELSHYTNLRPLWANDNNKKGASLAGTFSLWPRQ